MLFNCDVGEDSWECLGLQGDQTIHPKGNQVGFYIQINLEYSLERLLLKLKLQYFGHLMWRTDSWEKPWWERLKAGGEGDDSRWNGWIASLTQSTWVWASSWSWWWTRRSGVLQSMWLQRVVHNWTTELNWCYAHQPSANLFTFLQSPCLNPLNETATLVF